MNRFVKEALGAIAASVLSGGYWLMFFLFAEGFTAADYGPGMRPGEGFLKLKVAAVFIGGPVLFAMLIALWRRLTHRTDVDMLE